VSRILMISPHPTYTPRGTPISVLNRCRALAGLGAEVDLVTYGIGTDIPLPGLRWLRAPVPGIRTVKVGPSLAKLPLDLAVFVRAAWLALRGRHRYDALHTHEEAGLLGALLSRLTGLPHIYDMGNDMSVVAQNYGFGRFHPVTVLAGFVERLTVRGSTSVIAHFPSVAARARRIAHGRVPATVVLNVSLDAAVVPAVTARARASWAPDGGHIVLYSGTLEAYQGVPLLVEAMTELRDLPVRLVVVGGREDQQRALEKLAAGLGVADRVVVAGAVPQEDVPSLYQAADVLASPRETGDNTPLKLFSYLGSGRPVLATRIASHLQIVDDETAELVDPTPAALGAGIRRLLGSAERRDELGSNGRRACEERYGVRAYVAGVAIAYAHAGLADEAGADLDAATRAVAEQLSAASDERASTAVNA
jgi:glycosyltransferase involved in cell wall biosynthesis